MSLHTYHVEVASENPIPPDVLIEHIAVALREFHFAGKTGVFLKGTNTIQNEEPKVARNHPFEGPEVFDDYAPGTSREGDFTPVDPFPLTTRVIDKLKETRRHGNDRRGA